MASSFVEYLKPWKLRREKQLQRLAALRQRDGDNCRRCRRSLRFDLPNGRDQGVKIEEVGSVAANGPLDNLCLTHQRCNPAGADHTDEITDRIRRRNEAALLSRPRKRAGARR